VRVEAVQRIDISRSLFPPGDRSSTGWNGVPNISNPVEVARTLRGRTEL
jgi:hypothetical protein